MLTNRKGRSYVAFFGFLFLLVGMTVSVFFMGMVTTKTANAADSETKTEESISKDYEEENDPEAIAATESIEHEQKDSQLKHYAVGIIMALFLIVGLFVAILTKRKELNDLADNQF